MKTLSKEISTAPKRERKRFSHVLDQPPSCSKAPRADRLAVSRVTFLSKHIHRFCSLLASGKAHSWLSGDLSVHFPLKTDRPSINLLLKKVATTERTSTAFPQSTTKTKTSAKGTFERAVVSKKTGRARNGQMNDSERVSEQLHGLIEKKVSIRVRN